MANLSGMSANWPAEQPTVVGEHITLRPYRASDAPLIFEVCQDEAIQRYTSVPEPYTLADAESFIERTHAQWEAREEATFAAVDGVDSLMASIGLMKIDEQAHEGEIGYWVVPWARGLGVARTAVVRLADWGHQQLGITRFRLRIEETNAASIAAALAAGAVASDVLEPVELKGTIRQMRHYWLTR